MFLQCVTTSLIFHRFPHKNEFRKAICIKDIPILDSSMTGDYVSPVFSCLILSLACWVRAL